MMGLKVLWVLTYKIMSFRTILHIVTRKIGITKKKVTSHKCLRPNLLRVIFKVSVIHFPCCLFLPDHRLSSFLSLPIADTDEWYLWVRGCQSLTVRSAHSIWLVRTSPYTFRPTMIICQRDYRSSPFLASSFRLRYEDSQPFFSLDFLIFPGSFVACCSFRLSESRSVKCGFKSSFSHEGSSQVWICISETLA